MFKALKEKLKSWFGSAKSEAEKQEKIEEKLAKPVKKQEKVEIIKKKEGKKERGKEEKAIKKKEKQAEPGPKIQEEKLTTEATQAEKKGWFAKIRDRFRFKISQDYFDEIWYELEIILLENNVAIKVIDEIKASLESQLIGKEIEKSELEQEIKLALRQAVSNLLIQPFNLLDKIKSKKPYIILFVGINGSGKTTTIAKIAHLLKKNNLSCVLAAADTFRAASIEQLSLHAEKLNVPIIKHEYGSDPASVGFDAIKYAQAHNIDVVLIDTAGRMHTKTDLIREMEKIVRVTKPDLKIFIGEAITGNDIVTQCQVFNEAINIDAIILSKADVDDKGGTAISISKVTGKPILYLGTGQNYGDLTMFDKEKLIEQLGL